MPKANPLPHSGTLLRLNRTPQPANQYAAGLVPSKLTVAGFIKYMTLRLTGNIIVSVASATANFSQSPAPLIKRIDFVTSDNTILQSFTGPMLYRLNHFIRHKAQELVAPVLTVGTNPFAATFFLDMEALAMSDPSETLHDPSRWKDIFVNVTWGAVTDFIQAGAATVVLDTANTKLAITLHQTLEGYDQIEFDHLHSYVEIPVLQSNAFYELDIPGIGSLGGVLFETTRDAGAGAGPVPVDNIINNITFVAGGTQFHVNRWGWAEMQRDNISDFQLDGAAVLGNQIPGYGYLRLDDNRMLSSLFAIPAINKPKLVFDFTRTSGTELIRVLWDFYRLHPEARKRMQGAA